MVFRFLIILLILPQIRTYIKKSKKRSNHIIVITVMLNFFRAQKPFEKQSFLSGPGGLTHNK